MVAHPMCEYVCERFHSRVFHSLPKQHMYALLYLLKCALQVVQFDLAWWWRRLINDLRGSYFSNKVPYLWSSIPCTPQGKHVFSYVPESSPTKKRRYQFHHKVVTFCHTIVRIWKDLVSSAIECKLILVGRWLISVKPKPALTWLLCKKNKMRITMIAVE